MGFAKSMPKTLSILLAGVCLFLLSWSAPNTASAVDYYVSTSGSDEGTGGSGDPWKTLHHAIAELNSSSSGTYTLYVGSGTYNIADNGEDDDELILSQSDVTILGESVVGETIIDGTGASTWTKGLEITGSNVTIKNLYITNFSYGIKIDGCSPEINRNRIYDNEFNIGITAGNVQTASPIIKNNLIYDAISGAVVSYGISTGGSGTVSPKIYHNTIDGGRYVGIYIDEPGNTPDIKYNIITNFDQFGIQNSGNPTIDYNDVWNNGSETAHNYKDCSPGANDISHDPKYSSYNLLGTSPCINAIPTGDPPNDPVTNDIDGTDRPYGSGYDMGCYENTTLPAVTTTALSSISSTTASTGGNVTSGGSSAITARGVCWSTSEDPTTEDDHTSSGTGTGIFTSTLAELSPNTTYYVRAYATNSAGTSYGSNKSFSTLPAISPGTYYVDIRYGSDSNDGNSGSPWKTLHHAISQINGGATGTYVLHIKLAGELNYDIGEGESDSKLVITQDNVTLVGETGSMPVIDGTDCGTWKTGIIIEGDNVKIRNLAVRSFLETGIYVSSDCSGHEINGCEVHENTTGIADNSNGCTIKGCKVYSNNDDGITSNQTTNGVITENTVYGNGLGGGFRNGIFIAECSPEVSRNKVYDNYRNISIEGWSAATTSPTVKNNLIYEVSETVEKGIYVYANHASAVVSPNIYHNTIDLCKDGIALEENNGTSAPQIKFNIVTNSNEVGIRNTSANPTVEYNDVWNNTPNYSGFEGISDTNISENPLYGSYSLQADSPCINKIPVAAEDPVEIDYDGFKRPRPDETNKDMGAYEYVSDQTENYNLPGGTGAVTDYRMFTVPLKLGTGANMLTAMEQVLGTYDPVHWRGFLYMSTAYREFSSSQFKAESIVPGMGFWIITTYTNSIPFEGAPAPDGVDYIMDLQPGWHIIGLPWTGTQVSLGNMTVTDGVNSYAVTSTDNNLTQQHVWDYTGSNGYEKQTGLLSLNTGYFFKVEAASSIRLTIPHDNNQAQDAPVYVPPNQTNTNEDDEAPPPPPGSEPIPDIKANGEDGPVTVSAGDSVSVSVSLDPGAWSGRNADWWVAAHTPFGYPLDWYTYVYPEGWRYGIHVCAQTPLYELTPPFNVLNTVLPAGNYIFYFAVDGNMDGETDATWLDYVEVNVE